MVNAADDALPVEETVERRFDLAGRWLVTDGTASWKRAAVASPLTRSLVAVELLTLGGFVRAGRGDGRPAWVTAADGGAGAMRAIGEVVARFAQRHEGLRVVVVWAPLDATLAPGRPYGSMYARAAGPEGWDDGAARRGLVEGLGGIGVVDGSEVLGAGERVFLEGDHHWTVEGHRVVAEAVRERLGR